MGEQVPTNLAALIDDKGSEIYSVGPETSVADAISEMVEQDVGSVLVIDDQDQLVGIFTERDFLKLFDEYRHSAPDLAVETAMTSDLVLGSPDETLKEAAEKMEEAKIRHLPVVGEGGRVEGVLSARDLQSVFLKIVREVDE